MYQGKVKKSKILNKCMKKNPILAIVLIFVSVISGFFFGIDDQEAISLYIQKLQTLSEHKIQIEQIISLKKFYLRNKNRHPIKENRHRVRKEFNKQKSSLKREWQTKYGMIWPSLVLTKKGVAKSFSFEAHHIIPINAGGINRWWNMTPLTPRNHKILHSSMEEKACFSHDFLEKKYCRFVLKIKLKFGDVLSKKTVSSNIRMIMGNFISQMH